MKARRRMDAWQVISFVILGLYALFLVLPLFRLLRNSVIGPDGGYSLDYFRDFFTKKSYYGTLYNSFFVSIAVTPYTSLQRFPAAESSRTAAAAFRARQARRGARKTARRSRRYPRP